MIATVAHPDAARLAAYAAGRLAPASRCHRSVTEPPLDGSPCENVGLIA